uniref:Portal protein n=1 Tax=Myoviridae sp. ctrf010 TaxID=2825182 RepID=A0A8S5P2D1_9CAUD|nr:MAG TPA: Portal protein [Myoviridae sp. ctrf010]
MPTTKKQSKRNRNRQDQNIDELSMFDRAARNIFSVIDNSYSDRSILKAKDEKFRNILNRELEISKGLSQGSIVDFVHSIHLDQESKMKNIKSPDKDPGVNDLFTQNINDIFSYFQEMYRNKFIEMTDLKFIAKFIPALGEAVKTVLDAVVSSDNMAETVNRKIILADGVSDEDRSAIINEIERMEKELKLLKRLKTIVFKKSLIAGTHYVYAVSYNRIFEEYDAIKKRENKNLDGLNKGQFGNYVDQKNGKATESYVLGDVDITPAMESVRSILSNADPIDSKKKKLDSSYVKSTMDSLYESLPQIKCDSSTVYTEALESAATLSDSEGAFDAFVKSKNKGNNRNSSLVKNPLELTMPDGTIGSDEKAPRPSKFNIPGLYIKYIEPKQLIPLKIFDQVIGYYLIHPKAKKNKNSVGEVSGINSIGNTLFSAVNVGEAKKHDAVQRIVDTISEGILKNFDNKFVTQNAEYKKLISDVIIANGLTDKDYNIQFIPESDIIPFTIQENEDGFGESILSDSLFPAKLLLSMIVTRMLNYINKTGNKTIAHIHRGPVNVYDTNQLNRIIRDLQDQDVTFNDLLSPNLVFNKFNRDGNMAIPTTRDGNKLVEFEIQEGQQIDMNPEYEKELEQMAILGTGVPSVIMEYAGSADFAKQLVSANIKFAGRIASLQADLEEPTTLLYKKLCENSNLTDDQKAICAQSLEIKLPRPRVLVNSNNSEYVSSIIQTAEALAETALGRDTLTDTEKNPNGTRIKEVLVLKIVKNDSPFIDWDELMQFKEDAELEVAEEMMKKSQDGNQDNPSDNPF